MCVCVSLFGHDWTMRVSNGCHSNEAAFLPIMDSDTPNSTSVHYAHKTIWSLLWATHSFLAALNRAAAPPKVPSHIEATDMNALWPPHHANNTNNNRKYKPTDENQLLITLFVVFSCGWLFGRRRCGRRCCCRLAKLFSALFSSRLPANNPSMVLCLSVVDVRPLVDSRWLWPMRWL